MQRYRCASCRHQFQSARKSRRTAQAILNAYVWKRQTAVDLASVHQKSGRWVRTQIEYASVPERKLVPHTTPVVADMTFWGRSYGVCVFRSPTLKQNLWWKESHTETPWIYAEGLRKLLRDGWVFTGATIDGKRGVAQVFEECGIPVQYCQFHQQRAVTRRLTRRPKTEAGMALRAIALLLSRMNEDVFKKALTDWYGRYHTFLAERSVAMHKKRGWEYTHRNIRTAYRSLVTNMPRLFTYQKYPDQNIPNTTNTLDGMFSQLKNKLAVHRGLRRERRYKIISCLLLGKKKTASQKFH